MPTENSTASQSSEIVNSRIYNWSRALVFRAWKEPEHLQKWWGPNGFTNTFNSFNFKVGGRWSFIMHGPEKGNYPNEVEFTKIEEPSLIEWKRYSKPLFNVVVTFEELPNNETKLVFKQIFDSVEACNKVRPFAEVKNEENFDRLEAELKVMESQTE